MDIHAHMNRNANILKHKTEPPTLHGRTNTYKTETSGDRERKTSSMRTTLGCLINFIVAISRLICQIFAQDMLELIHNQME